MLNNNDKGFFEDLEVNELNTELLAALNRDWHSLSRIPPESLQSEALEPLKLRAIELMRTKIGDQTFGLKNPRIGRLLPFWQAVFDELDIKPSYVIAIRNPKSVAQSLQKRDGFDFEKSYYLWLEHVLPTILETGGATRVVVDFDLLMADPSGQLERMAKALGLPFDPDSPRVQEYLSEFLDSNLRHSQFELEDLSEDRAAASDVRRAYQMLVRLGSGNDEVPVDPIEEEFEAIETRLNAMSPALEYMSRSDERVAGLVELVAERDAWVAERDAQLDHHKGVLAERTDQIESLNADLAERDNKIIALDQLLATRGARIADLEGSVAERDRQLHDLNVAAFDRNRQIHDLNELAFERSQRINELSQVIFQRDQTVAVQLAQIGRLQATVSDLLSSTSWRLSAPVRFFGRQLLRVKAMRRAVYYARTAYGGHLEAAKAVSMDYRVGGLSAAKRRIVSWALADASPTQISSAEPDRNDYAEWIRRYDTLDDSSRDKIKTRIRELPHTPLISVIMPVYNPPLPMLEAAIKSVQRQLYPHWELCIADDASTDKSVRPLLRKYAESDPRIKVTLRERNGHIAAASNSAIDLACGEFIAFLDNDDLLAESALYWVSQAITDHPNVALIYSDEDKINELGARYAPYFKPDWNPDLFLSQNMVSHLGAYRTELVRELGGFREGYEGSQDYDLALRCIERLEAHQIHHIPRVLYHWRSHPGSTAKGGSEKPYALTAGQRALDDHFVRLGVSARAELLPSDMYRVHYEISRPVPLVSLLIPTRNGLHLIKQCVQSIVEKTLYPNIEILIIDNGSDDPATLEYLKSLRTDPRIRVLRDDQPFNFSALNNSAVRSARGVFLGLVNNDIEVISPGWLGEMVSLAQQPGVGAVGARLLYPNGTLQHGGVICGILGVAGHAHRHLPVRELGYFGRATLIQSLSAVTAACLVIRKSTYEEVCGLDEANLKVAFNDVDFCLRIREAGYRNVWTPYAELIHHESATRGEENSPEKRQRFEGEVTYMQKHWGPRLLNDPAYNPNLTFEYEDFSLAWPPRVERP